MLVLTRKISETIIIDDHIKIEVIQVRKGGVRIGITAPDEVRIRRGELAPTQSARIGANRLRITSECETSTCHSSEVSSKVLSGKLRIHPSSKRANANRAPANGAPADGAPAKGSQKMGSQRNRGDSRRDCRTAKESLVSWKTSRANLESAPLVIHELAQGTCTKNPLYSQ